MRSVSGRVRLLATARARLLEAGTVRPHRQCNPLRATAGHSLAKPLLTMQPHLKCTRILAVKDWPSMKFDTSSDAAARRTGFSVMKWARTYLAFIYCAWSLELHIR